MSTLDLFTVASVLRAISTMSAFKRGSKFMVLFVQNGLVSMNAKCGSIDDSKRVFAVMDEHDVISWNSLLSGCSHHGLGWETLELFKQ